MNNSDGLIRKCLSASSPGSRLAGYRHIPRQAGFTLVELLIVVAIIGILAVIAVPQMNSYREKAFCAEIRADLATLAAHQESYFIDNHIYLVVTQAADNSSNMPNFRWTPGVILVSSTGGSVSWKAVVAHPNCTSSPLTWDSALGGLQ